MKSDSVRTTVDIPSGVYRRLKARAAAMDCSVRELVLVGIRAALLETPRRRKRSGLPSFGGKSPKVNLTNEMIYEHIEFP